LNTPSRIRAVTFDVDGTLTDASALRLSMLLRNLTRLRSLRVGHRVREELRGTRFPSGEAMRAREAELVGERLGVDAAQARERLDAIFDASLTAALRARGPAVHLGAALRTLVDGGLSIGVVSDRRVDDKLAALGLDALPWAARVSADDTGILKPDPETLVAAARALGVEPYEIAHVGDRDDTDGAAARAAGARFFLVDGPAHVPHVCREIVDSLDADPPSS
jgi:putative hydrolase of the HAD superfamily